MQTIVFSVSSVISADETITHHIETGVCSEPRYKDTTWYL